MKFVKLLTVLVFVLSVVVVGAQEESEPLSGFYIINAPVGGEVVDNGDETYSLTLSGVLPEVTWVLSQPVPYMGTSDLLLMTTEWVSSPGLVATALLEAGDVVVEVSLSEPTYDDFLEDFTATFTVVDIYSSDEEAELVVPDFFDTASLAIITDDAFELGLTFGAEIMASEGRAVGDNEKKRTSPPNRSSSGRLGGNRGN